jgi:D-amino peptidase
VKVYILTDMEGISGIWRQEMVEQGAGEWYAQGRKLMMGDLNAAIAGAFDGGATGVIVNDGHGGAPHIFLEEMDERAEYVRPESAGNVFPGLDDGFGAMFCVGAHAMAGTQSAFLDHTQSSMSWYNYFVNGRKYGEIGQMAIIASHWGLPVTMVCGDEAACIEARALLGEDRVATAAVKCAIGRQFAHCLHPKVARQRIREAAELAVRQIGQPPALSLDLPATVRLEYYRTDMADAYQHHLRVRRVGPREIEMTVERACDILNWS